MRKIYSFLLALAATSICTTAALAENSATIKVDDVSRVEVVVGYDNPKKVAFTDNTCTITSTEDYEYITVRPASVDFGLTSVAWADGNGNSGSEYVSYDGTCMIYLSASSTGRTYNVTSFSYADMRTEKCTVKVDDASKVSLRRNGTYTDLPLQNGDNEIAFIPSGDKQETPLEITGTGSALYQVLLNNEVQTAEYSNTYRITPANGDVIEVKANWPDKDVPVHFVAGNEGSKGFIASVLVDGKEVTDWDTDNFTVKLGSSVEFVGDVANYKVDSVFINGKKEYFYNRGNLFIATEDAQTVTYYATKYKTYNITVIVDHADRLTLNKVIDYSEYPVELKDGENTVEISETCTGLSYKAKGGCKVETFVRTTDGKDYIGCSSWQPAPVAEGDTFNITTWAIDRKEEFVVYIDDPSKATYGGRITFVAKSIYENQSDPLPLMDADGNFIEGGYYVLPIDTAYDNPVQIDTYGATPIIYQQDNVVDTKSGTRITVADKDVVKVFLAGTPDTLDVAFAVDENCAECAFNEVVRDIIVAVEDVTAPFAVLTGTQVSFKQTGADEILVNNEALAADENGVYTVTITADTRIVAKGQEQAIENAEATLNHNVYTLQGMLLIKDATPAQINALPAGLYIISGKTTYLLKH